MIAETAQKVQHSRGRMPMVQLRRRWSIHSVMRFCQDIRTIVGGGVPAAWEGACGLGEVGSDRAGGCGVYRDRRNGGGSVCLGVADTGRDVFMQDSTLGTYSWV